MEEKWWTEILDMMDKIKWPLLYYSSRLGLLGNLLCVGTIWKLLHCDPPYVYQIAILGSDSVFLAGAVVIQYLRVWAWTPGCWLRQNYAYMWLVSGPLNIWESSYNIYAPFLLIASVIDRLDAMHRPVEYLTRNHWARVRRIMAVNVTIAVTLMLPNAIFNWELVPFDYGPNNETEWELKGAVKKRELQYPSLRYYYLVAGLYIMAMFPVLFGLTIHLIRSVNAYYKSKGMEGKEKKSVTHLMLLQALLILFSTLPKTVNEFILVFGFRWIYETTDWDRFVWWWILIAMVAPASFNSVIYITFSKSFRGHLGQFITSFLLRARLPTATANPTSSIRTKAPKESSSSNSVHPVEVQVSPAPSNETEKMSLDG